MEPTLLIVAHSRSGATKQLADAVHAGATDRQIRGVRVDLRHPFDVEVADVVAAGAIILGTPTNFGYMSGALKDFFDRVYDDCLDVTRGRPYALFVKGRNDTSGAVRSVQPIVSGLGWREVRPPLEVEGDLEPDHLAEARELGMMMAAGLALDAL